MNIFIRNMSAGMLILFLSVSYLNAQSAQSVKVKYVSAGHIYLDAGASEGIAIGDTVRILKNDRNIALLKVVFVAESSANCEIISKQREIKVGDKAVVLIHKQIQEDSKPAVNQTRTRDFTTARGNQKKSKTRISGYISAQWYQFMDADAGRYDFSQPALRLNFNARNLWNDSYNIRIRARSRYNERARSFSADVPRTEWRNRIYEFSFAYENPASVINYKFGRIISNKFSGVGYIDGGQLQHNISNKLNWGIFAGTQPEWQYSDFQTSYQKFGSFVNYTIGNYSSKRYESTLALAGTYHGSAISREVLFFQNNYNHYKKWTVYQSLEMDLNRAWRKEKTGESLSLSGLYINGRYYITDNLNFGISYDNRKNYYTYELRTLADSLFDNAFRQGARVSFSARFLKNYRFYLNSGIRKRDTGSLTYSYSGGFNAANILRRRITASLRFAGFSNLYTQGINPALDITKYFSAGHFIQVGYGIYRYTLKSNDSSRSNQYLRVNGELELPLNLFLASDYEYSFGDDSEGHRILAEFGYRF